MKAMVQDRYGPPEEVLRLEDIETPEVGDGEVLVRVAAGVVTETDWHLLRGLPYLARLTTGIRRPKNRVVGLEFAGTVEEVDRSVTDLEVGTQVFDWCDGSYAEYAAVPAGQLAPMPAGIGFDEAAAAPIAGFTALQSVRDLGRVAKGDRVLITGASGGVGLYAIQIAKWLGAEVTAVCSGAKRDLVEAVGADQVVDYTRENFADEGRVCDVLIDLYGNPKLRDCRRVLRPDRTYPMDQAADAIRYVTEGLARGQVATA